MGWLGEYCHPNFSYNTEIVTMICLEFARKTYEQSQNKINTSSANTTN